VNGGASEVLVAETSLLRVSVTRDPWAISFGALQTAEPLRCQMAPRRAPGAALDGMADPPEDARLWTSATRVIEDEVRHGVGGQDAYRATLATDDPGAQAISLSVRVLDEGTVSVRARAPGAAVVGQGFLACQGERFLGFGERSHAVSLARGVIENYVGEGPFQAHEYQFLTDTVPPWGIRERTDATYFPIPWVLSSAGYGLLIDRDELSYERFRTAGDERWSIEVESDTLAFRLFAGPAPLEALGRFTAATGRQPSPERWFFGPWYQSGHDNHVPLAEEARQIELLRGSPASVAETHCRYLPVGEQRGHEEAERARPAQFHGAGLAALSYLNPIVSVDYPEAFDAAVGAGALQRRASGEPYVFRAYAGGRVPPHTMEAQYDFTIPTATACWGEVAGQLVAAGYDGWMEDFGEYTPLDALHGNGATGTAAHNRYPTAYHSAAADATAQLETRYGRRLARFVRSGWTGTAGVVPIVWGGDPTTSWGFDGLRSAVIEGLSMGASGVAVWGSDIGGFFSTLDRLTPDLLRRWIQFASFSPVMRTKAGGIEVPPYERPQIWDDDMIGSWRRWAGWHTRLNDYLMASYSAYRETGRPIMCALELVDPGTALDDQYLLGNDLLVAPVLEPDCRVRRVYLPPGDWVDLWEPARRLRGPQWTEVPVGPDDMPVFVRAGALLCLLPESTVSLSPYAPAIEDRRDVLAFPHGIWEGELGPGLFGRSALTGDAWTLELDADQPIDWRVTAHLARAPVDVRSGPDLDVSVDAGTLTASTRGRSAIVRATF